MHMVNQQLFNLKKSSFGDSKAVFHTPDLNEENREETTGWRSLASLFTPWVYCKLKIVSISLSFLLHANIMSIIFYYALF